MTNSSKKPAGRVVVIGLDGATFSLLDPLMQEGRMPNLKRLMESGARGPLMSIIPPVTPAAWSSFMTGKNPGRHNIFEFIVKDEGGESPVNSTHRKSKTVFKLVNEAGMKVVSLSLPTTYPPEKLDGFMVSDFLTPKGNKDYGSPPELLKEIEDKFGAYHLYMSEVYAPGRIAPLIDDAEEDTRYKFEVAKYLLKKIDWKLFVFHIFGTDRLQHELWHLIDPNHPLYKPEETRLYSQRFLNFYNALDEKLGQFFEMLDPSDNIFIISDHGFGPVYRFINMNIWFLEKGYLKLKNSFSSRAKKALFDIGLTPKNAYVVSMHLGLAHLRQTLGITHRAGFFAKVDRVILSLRDVDWSKTVAYSKGYYGQIFINLKGRNPHGIVEPADYESVRDKIIGELRELTDPINGKKLIGPIYKTEELYSGEYIGNAPDISFLPADMTYKVIGTADFTSNKFLEWGYANSGDHRLDGIFIANGPGIRSGHKIDKANLFDVTPTILYALGLPVPDDMDGRVIADCFEPEHIAARPVNIVKAASHTNPDEKIFSDDEKEAIVKNLKNLGYL